MTKNTIANDLLYGRKKICFFGIGYIGFTSAIAYASKGVKVLAYDIEPTRVELFREGKTSVPNLREWLGFDPTVLARHGLLDATTDWQDLIVPENNVFVVAVPTEKNGFPFKDYVMDVLEKIATTKTKHPLILIESTISMNFLPDIIYPILCRGLGLGNFSVGVIPRRDWFDEDSSHTLKNMPRVVGVDNDTMREEIENIVRIVSPDVRRASSCKIACLTKQVENCIRMIEIGTAIQLSNAYPRTGMLEALNLAGQKWNIPTLFGSCRVSGYCLNIAPLYLQLSAEHPEELTLLSAALQTNDNQPAIVAQAIANRGVKKVLILGLSYKADVPVWTESPSIQLSKNLEHLGIETRVHDPYFSAQIIKEKCGIEGVEGDFLQLIPDYDAIVLISGHREYKSIPKTSLLNAMKNTKLIIDNDGSWDRIDFGVIEYQRIGTPGWRGE
ncbi:MAG: Nucleotide sugar dehydrogenase family protein [Candidatus Gottesmanbacteria bacterium GW2011_GWB1_49_7]|uniref:Nucleotide sugar dehydrogenase family protein n=1 Tax=Candidatus Gottesmanbacteria bacterium GW2011_GWB1_49_7 TaxID=1618448 RepID=A0A0G1YC70_9BACT|nr:MAG: Nucleotide sugar dehydrogenase family protein [Candidatus Gottesmanbacteria bacterium GW2011_GWB1_49_7]